MEKLTYRLPSASGSQWYLHKMSVNECYRNSNR